MSNLNNADQPANPTVHTNAHLNGLTKREQFAAMAMQAMLSRPYHVTTRGFCPAEAVNYADALLEELEANK